MEPLLIIILPGILGGIALAILMMRFPVRPGREGTESHLDAPSTNIINMARIRIVGVGGLGMVAMAAVVAIFVPRIRSTMILAFVLGVVFATTLIALRRRKGPLSSSNDPGAHTMLPLGTSAPRSSERDPSAPYSPQELAVAPHHP